MPIKRKTTGPECSVAAKRKKVLANNKEYFDELLRIRPNVHIDRYIKKYGFEDTVGEKPDPLWAFLADIDSPEAEGVGIDTMGVDDGDTLGGGQKFRIVDDYDGYDSDDEESVAGEDTFTIRQVINELYEYKIYDRYREAVMSERDDETDGLSLNMTVYDKGFQVFVDELATVDFSADNWEEGYERAAAKASDALSYVTADDFPKLKRISNKN